MSKYPQTSALSTLCFSLSLMLHILMSAALYAIVRGLPTPAQADRKAVKAIQIFVPEMGPAVPAFRVAAGRSFDHKPVKPALVAATAEITVDFNFVRLSFATDVGRQLPGIVSMHHGTLALLDKEDPAIAHYLLVPPEWRMDHQVIDVSGKLRVFMDPPAEWSQFRDASLKYSINLENFQACALFDISYRNCLMKVIRDRAAMQSFPAGWHVTAARLTFNAEKPCGVEVTEVFVSHAPV